MRTCYKCKIEKELTDFYKCNRDKEGYQRLCIACHKQYAIDNREQVLTSKKKYRDNLSPEQIEKRKAYYQKNKEYINAKCKENYQKNKVATLATNKEYRNNNREKINAKNREKRASNKELKFRLRLSNRVYLAFKNKSWRKRSCTEELLGLDYDSVRKYIERQFKKGMTWDNHGVGHGKWQVDHKIPLSSAKTEEEMIKLCHYTNLQPLWAIDNSSKRDKILPTQIILTL